ncbi:MAG: acyltransferase [Myxococcota bacterium]
MPSQQELAPSREYFRGFDGLRGIAVSLVLVGHIVQQNPHLPRKLPNLVALPLGSAVGSGVDVFFVLSGFLITTILLAERGKPAALRVFWVRRFLRIFPPYYALLVVLLFVYPTDSIKWAAAYLSNYYFVFFGENEPLSPTWSLAVEEHFYLLWPLVALTQPAERAKKILILGVLPFSILSTVVLGLLDVEHLKMLTYKGTHARCLSLGIGCLIAIVRMQGDDRVYKRTIGGIYGFLLVVLVAAGLADPRFHPLVTQSRFALASVTLFLVGLHAPPGSWIMAGLEWRPLTYLGRISYGVYLYHMPVYFIVAHFSVDLGNSYAIFAALALVKVVATIVVASLSFAFLERPALKLKSKWSHSLRQRVAPA